LPPSDLGRNVTFLENPFFIFFLCWRINPGSHAC
jgi:hypothetical protein